MSLGNRLITVVYTTIGLDPVFSHKDTTFLKMQLDWGLFLISYVKNHIFWRKGIRKSVPSECTFNQGRQKFRWYQRTGAPTGALSAKPLLYIGWRKKVNYYSKFGYIKSNASFERVLQNKNVCNSKCLMERKIIS